MGKTNVKAKVYTFILGIPQRDRAQLSLMSQQTGASKSTDGFSSEM